MSMSDRGRRIMKSLPVSPISMSSHQLDFSNCTFFFFFTPSVVISGPSSHRSLPMNEVMLMGAVT